MIIKYIKCNVCQIDTYFNINMTEKYKNIKQMLAFDQNQSDLLEEENNIANS